MRRIRRSLIAVACAAAVTLATAGQAVAHNHDLTGRWKTASLKMDGVGYSMLVSDDDGSDVYKVALRFHYQDGTRGAWQYGTLRENGTTVRLRLPSESSALRGTIGMDGSIYLPTCYTQLDFVTKKMRTEACLFQQLPN